MFLNFERTKELLLDYKIPFCRSALVSSKKKAIKEAKKIGYPIVLKIYSLRGEHKSDKRGVIVDISDKKELIRAFNKLSKLRNDGFLIQEFISGRELIVGMKKDNQFGPVLVFGLGGIFTEIMNDISLRIAPLTKKEVLEMIKETKVYQILKGARGEDILDIKGLVDLIMSLSEMSLKENISEVDFNPVIINKKGVFIVDARIFNE